MMPRDDEKSRKIDGHAKAGEVDDFDEFVQGLQREIDERELEMFTPRVLELSKDPTNWGKISGKNVITGSYLGPCGDTMVFYLDIQGDRIARAGFTTSGCGASVAAGAQATIMITGKRVDEALRLEPGEIDAALGGLPGEHKHCAELAVRTLRGVLAPASEKGA